MPVGCPCGAHVRSGYDDAHEVSSDLLSTLISDAGKLSKFWWILVAFVGAIIPLRTICAQPKPRMPEFEWSDLINYPVAQTKVLLAIYSKIYELGCECDDCPPLTNCGTGFPITVTPEDGYFPDPDEPGVKQYKIPFGTEIYAQRADGVCLGFKSGIEINWHIDDIFDPTHGMSVCNGNGSGCHNYDIDDVGGGVTLYFGAAPNPPHEPWAAPPAGWPDYPLPAPCTNSDICATLGRVDERLQRVEFLTQVMAGPVYGVTAPYLFQLPGLNTPISGALVDALPRALAALAPLQPAQLENPETVIVDTSGVVELDGESYCAIELVTVPTYMGSRGVDDTLVYYSNARGPGPGWYCVLGQEGVLSYSELVFGEGHELVLPATATAIAIHLSPGVEVEVTTWERHV